MADNICGFTGNPDIYGLGVRLGAYLLWFSSQIAYYFHLDAALDLTEASQTFSLALTIATFLFTLQPQETEERARPVEAVITLLIIIGGQYSSFGASAQSQELRPLWWRYLLLNASLVAIHAYASWFWITGASGGHFMQTAGCGTALFLITRVPPHAFRAVSIFFGILSSISVSGNALWLWPYLEYLLAVTKDKIRPLSESLKKDILEHINAHCRESIDWLATNGPEAPTLAFPDPYVEDISPTHLFLRSDMGEGSRERRLYRPIINIKDPSIVQRRIDTMVELSKFLESDLDNLEDDATTTTLPVVIKNPIALFLANHRSPFFRKISLSMALVSAIITILAIELTLVWNEISGVYDIKTTGQLIPFVIGVLGLFKTLYLVHFERKVRPVDYHKSRN
jgi:hypothetical protein